MLIGDDIKREFALRLLEFRGDAVAASQRVAPFDIPTRLALFNDGPGDPIVIREMDRIIAEHGHASFLPDKAALCAAIFESAGKAKTTDEKLKAFKLYADVMGFIEKPGTVVTNNNLVDNRSVVVVRDFGSDDEWEKKLQSQQTRLIADASEPIANAA